MTINFTFATIAIGIGKLFVLMLAGYILYHIKLIDEKFVDRLSQLLVKVIFPALIISKTIQNFSFTAYTYWWMLPVAAIIFSLTAMAIGSVVFKSFRGFSSRKEFICSCGFQNCGYLPMNLIIFSFSGMLADKLLIYTFLFILGFNLLMWSLVPLFLKGNLKKDFKLSVFLNPPVVATLFSLLWVAIFGRGTMPAIIMDPVSQLGHAAFPIAMLTLGAYLYKHRAHRPENKVPLISGIIIKLILFPAIVLVALTMIPMGIDYKFFLFLQAVMPTAVSLVVIGGYTGADNKYFSSIIFYTHVISIISIPIWFAVFQAFIR